MKVLHGDVVDVLLEELDLGGYVWLHMLGAARGVEVAGQGVGGLVHRLVEDTKVGPGRAVELVQLHCADVGLQSIHRLVLLLVKHSN